MKNLFLFILLILSKSLLCAQPPVETGFRGTLGLGISASTYGPKVYYFPIDRHLLMRHYASNAGMLGVQLPPGHPTRRGPEKLHPPETPGSGRNAPTGPSLP